MSIPVHLEWELEQELDNVSSPHPKIHAPTSRKTSVNGTGSAPQVMSFNIAPAPWDIPGMSEWVRPLCDYEFSTIRDGRVVYVPNSALLQGEILILFVPATEAATLTRAAQILTHAGVEIRPATSRVVIDPPKGNFQLYAQRGQRTASVDQTAYWNPIVHSPGTWPPRNYPDDYVPYALVFGVINLRQEFPQPGGWTYAQLFLDINTVAWTLTTNAFADQ
jgi:hypothetical protein